jgi:hypothetical protein
MVTSVIIVCMFIVSHASCAPFLTRSCRYLYCWVTICCVQSVSDSRDELHDNLVRNNYVLADAGMDEGSVVVADDVTINGGSNSCGSCVRLLTCCTWLVSVRI